MQLKITIGQSLASIVQQLEAWDRAQQQDPLSEKMYHRSILYPWRNSSEDVKNQLDLRPEGWAPSNYYTIPESF